MTVSETNVRTRRGEGEAWVPALRSGVFCSGTAEEVTLVDTFLGQVIQLDKLGTRIVLLMDGKAGVEELCHRLAELIGHEEARVRVSELLTALDRQALLDTPRAQKVISRCVLRADFARLTLLSTRQKMDVEGPSGALRLQPNQALRFSDYADWEVKTIEALEQSGGDPLKLWCSAMERLAHAAVIKDDRTESPRSAKGLPDKGFGATSDQDREALDLFLRDLSMWAELLRGIEQEMASALENFRRVLCRLRLRLGVNRDDPALLHELARRSCIGPKTDLLVDERSELGSSEAGHPSRAGEESGLRKESIGWELYRLFVQRALLEKRHFECGDLSRGLLLISVFVALMRVELAEEEPSLEVLEDLERLFVCAPLLDIIDTRASFRTSAQSAGVHRTLLLEI